MKTLLPLLPPARLGSLALVGLVTSGVAGIAVATVDFAHAPVAQQATSPDAAALVRTAMERIGGEAWSRIRSFESIATVKSAMGDARVEYRFVAPSARQLVQVMPGGRGVVEMGVVDGVAWMGEPGRARAIDPKLAEEMSGGGDLQTLVHSLSERFEHFEVAGKATIGGREAWRIAMTPRAATGAPRSAQRWTLFIDSANTTILGIDIPAPAKDLAADAPEQSGQSIRFSDWQSVETAPPAATDARPSADDPRGSAARDLKRLLSFRTATVEAGGMKTELVFTRVAVDTLGKGSIAPPARIEPAASPR